MPEPPSAAVPVGWRSARAVVVLDEGDEPEIVPHTGRPIDVAEFSRSLARCDLPEPGAPNSDHVEDSAIAAALREGHNEQQVRPEEVGLQEDSIVYLHTSKYCILSLFILQMQ